MHKIHIKHSILLLSGILALLIISQLQVSPAYAASNGQVTIAMPNNAPLVGHVGTRVLLTGNNFPANGTVNLFTTPANAPNKCKVSALQNPTNYNLTPFASAPTTNADGQGSFQLDTTWSSGANIATTNYYICAIATSSGGGSQQGATAFSKQSFTVAQPVQVSVSTQNAQPGGTITVTGSGWLPPQMLTVAIQSNNGVLISTNVQASSIDPMSGNFSTTLTIPSTADPRDYDVKVSAPNEASMSKTLPGAITVGTAAATATPATTPTPQATASAQAVATATPIAAGSGNAGGGSSLLVFALGGLGVVLVIVGITVFVIYSRGRTV